MKCIVISHCYNVESCIIASVSGDPKKSIDEIEIKDGENLVERIRTVLKKLNDDDQYTFWVVHQIVLF